ncbi:MAG: 16S rRNA (cytidine(1402)-2'-O)-methyltransferase [Verrucomicrobiales bacterium]|nr:16S rRNA (cytidine(1402)-2'-O)-methyltransferase [Verrucomicrobiales bacterium]HQW27711.1 16S rRNA (cytidine(1402)-2'-O)-methyltransferase [Verrucomicrobiales bacterium]
MKPFDSSGLVQLICTPIGNLGDITFRAVESIKAAHVVACEDTRHSRRLLNHLGITDKELVALHEHNEQYRSQSLVERALNGERIVFLSDAGTPTISDPGYRLVNACHEAGVKLEVIPGPSAVITALAGSGLPTDAFYFGGFLPVKSGRKSREIEEALARRETSIYFESPHRLTRTLAAIAALDPEREVCVARELTKKFETYRRASAEVLRVEFTAQPGKGEITLLIRGSGKR